MKRSILLALVAALALAVGVNASASAGAGASADAQATAKKKAAKKKAGKRKAAKRKAAKCKTTAKGKRKAKRRARRSLAGSAQSKRKGRKRAARCKAKSKKKGKAKRKAGAFKLADGSYKHESVTVTVSGGGTRASASFPLSCLPFSGNDMPLTTSGDSVTASETYSQPIAGLPSMITWTLTVRSTLGYTLRTSWNIDVGDGGTCNGRRTFGGKLVKTR